VTVALLAIMLDEAAYAERWAYTIERAAVLGVAFDQVVVIDGGSSDDTVAKLARKGVSAIGRTFDDFSAQRNFGIEQCHTDWIFELDADEYPAVPLLVGLRDIARDADKHEVDSVGIARLNLIDGHLVPGPGHNGLDYQYRFHRRECRWSGIVHEELSYHNRIELNFYEGHMLVHDKDSKRHQERNDYYRTLASA
jgi:glycosyltransferase involved in cell wall biosynthesis